MKSSAITFGRYDICSTAHMHTIRVIADHYDKVVVGVIDDSHQVDRAVGPLARQYYAAADQQHEKNRFTLFERMQMLSLSVEDAGLADRVMVVPIFRPECNIQGFNERFPAATHQLVFGRHVSDAPDNFEALRNKVLPVILQRKINFVPVTFTLHCSEIRKQAELQPNIWEEVMSPSAYSYFCSIDGRDRAVARSVDDAILPTA